jgi:hypothetical protein
MLKDISTMQERDKQAIEGIINEEKDSAKRTTIILEKEEREFIDKLIREGKEPGIKPLISKMLDVYRSMMIYDWRFPGEYYCGISRIAFLNIELVNISNSEYSKRKVAGNRQKNGRSNKSFDGGNSWHSNSKYGESGKKCLNA